jgi:hypothetical protein
MKMRKQTIAICLAGLCLFFLSTVIAGEDIPKVIKFKGNPDGGGSEDIHPSAYTGQVVFQHAKHAEEYSEGCGSCHHNSDMEPIEKYDLDEVYTCIDCHSEEGYVRGPIAENANSEGDLNDHRANVIHMVCINCHKEHNAQAHTVIAPEACRKCHAKRPADYTLK